MAEKIRLFYVPIGHSSHESSIAGRRNDEFVRKLYLGINSFVDQLPQDLSGYLIFNDSSTSDDVNNLNTRQGQTRFTEHLRTTGLTPDKVPQDYVVLRLLSRRARMVHVEDQTSLREQRSLIASGGTGNWTQEMRNRFEELNKTRDRKIATELEKSLKKQKNSTGILFLGAAHQVDQRLSSRGVIFTVPPVIFQRLSPEEIAALEPFVRFAR